MARGRPHPQAQYAIRRHAYGGAGRPVRAGIRHERSFSDGGCGCGCGGARRPAPAVAGVASEIDANGEVRLWRAKTCLAQGQALQKTFSISRYGAHAQAMAQGERLRQLQSMEGHCPGLVFREAGGRSYWTAQTTQGGRWVSRSFSIQEHGEEMALLLAIMERLDQRDAHDRAGGPR